MKTNTNDTEANQPASAGCIPQLVSCFFDGAPHLIHCAFRYYLGRMTIATCQFAHDLAKAWPLLPESTASMIRRELEEHFNRDDEARLNGSKYKPLGMDCDRAAWERVRRVYSANSNIMESEDSNNNENRV